MSEVPATRYAIFLRGVNVGGIRITSAALREMLAALPLDHVRTLLASGNVVCAFRGEAGALKDMVEQALRATFGYQAWVVVLTAQRLGELLDACPYPADSTETHTYVTVSSDPAVLDELAAAVAAADPGSVETRLGPEATAWLAPVGGTLDAVRSTIAAKARYKPSITDRNLRTMLKVRAAVEAVPGE